VQPPSSRLVAEVVIPVMSPSALSSGSLGTFFQRVGQHGTPVVAEAHELDHFFELLPTFPWNLLVERLVYSLRSVVVPQRSQTGKACSRLNDGAVRPSWLSITCR
jgi:hypothetical protein